MLSYADVQLLHQSGSMVATSHTRSSKNANGKGGAKKGKISRGSSTYIDDTAAPYLPLPAGMLNIKRLVNANIAEPSNQKITGACVVV